VIDEVGDFSERRFAMNRFERKVPMLARLEFYDDFVWMHVGNPPAKSLAGDGDGVTDFEFCVSLL
jgi:hypothetical protein